MTVTQGLAAIGLAGPEGLALFMTAVFVLNATPGVDLLLTVSRTLQGGVRAGIAVAVPAVLSYNVFGKWIAGCEAELEGFAHDLRELFVHRQGP